MSAPHHLTHDGRVAVAADVFWLPIDATTPRNVKVLAISRERSGVLQVAEIRTDEKWLTHWHPLPRFRMDGDCSSHQANRVAAPVQAQPAKPLESKLVDALLDFDVRGMCAAELLCWHRLTEAESDQLVEFVKIIKEQP